MPVRTIKVEGPVILDWGNGIRFQLTPLLEAASASEGGKRRGRKPNPATQAVIDAMQADAAKGAPRSRAEYLSILEEAGHKGTATAGIIIAREAKRAFGHTLGRAKETGRGGGGRKASPLSAQLREKLQQDKAGEGLRDPAHYVRWLVDKSNLGLKRVRPVVYRELRAAKA
ncbi:MAG: hypothetical protein LC620_08360 [Halobacteriales archaeon]|nr:hypothetical protein [Halobacteriales archaeon]